MGTDNLVSIGLTNNEAIVYEKLASLGPVPVSRLTSSTGFHPQIVYSCLDSLASKKLVSMTIRDHIKWFSVSDPHQLTQNLLDKMEMARGAEKEIVKLAKKAYEKQKVSIFQGKKAVVMARRFILDSISDSGTYYVLNANIKEFGKAMGGEFERQEREVSKRRIKQIFLGYKSQARELVEFAPRYFKKVDREFFFLDQTSSVPMSVDFSEQRVAILVFGMEPLAIGITDRTLASGYKAIFESLLNLASKYKPLAGDRIVEDK